MTKKNIFKVLVNLFAGMAFTLVMGILFYVQDAALDYSADLKARFQLAVFVEKGVSVDVVKEKIDNTDKVFKSEFVPQGKILETTLKSSPLFKDIIASGENPFTPYFLVYPVKLSSTTVKKIADTVKVFEHVEDVKYDPEAVSVFEQLSAFSAFIGFALKFSSIILALIVAVKLTFRILKRKIDISSYLFNIASGAVSGLLGCLALFLIHGEFFASSADMPPTIYILYFIIAGMLSVLAIEN